MPPRESSGPTLGATMSATDLLWPLIQWAVANLFLLGLTGWVWREIRLGSPAVDLPLFVFLYVFLTTALAMFCGLTGALHPAPIALASLAGCAVLGWKGRGRIRSALAQARGLALRLADAEARDLVFLAAVLAVAARIAVHVWYLPPYVWDTLSYHLPKVAEWVQSHRLSIFDTPVDRTFWPANLELFQTWFVLFPHHDVLIDLACVPFYVLACAAVYAIARRLGLGRRWATAAGLIYGLTPAPLQHATSGKNDMPIASLFLFLVALLLDARTNWRFPRRRLLILTMVLGFAVGMKAYILFLVPGLGVIAAWTALAKPWRARPDPAPDARRLSTWLAAALAASALLLGGYWYLRNALIFGNPFYPAEPRILDQYLFDSEPGDRERQGVILSAEALGENLRAFVTQRIFDRVYFHFSLQDITGWGWFAFACGWPALIFALLVSASVRWLFGAFAASFLTLYSCIVPDPWNMRFAQWFPALFAVSFAVAVRHVRVRPLRRGVYVVALACLGLNFLGSLDVSRLSPWTWLRMARLPVLERSTAALGLFIGPGYLEALEKVPKTEAIGYNTNYNGWIYPLYDADLSRRVRYVPVGPETDVVAAMRKREVDYLFVALPPPVVQRRIDQEVARRRLRTIGRGLYVVAE